MSYINEDFLFDNETGKHLYYDFAESMPIYDYHCHLNPKEIADDHKYRSITEIWLGGDHYKWRAMRINGIAEKYITGDGEDFEKFKAFAKTLDQAIGNPLYQWSHLELSRYFGIDRLLSEESAASIFEEANEKLKNISARSLIRDSKVTHINTTDDPTDDLAQHERIAADKSLDVLVRPTFRPDAFFKGEKADFSDRLKQLEEKTGIKIKDLSSYMQALEERVDYFHERGCRLADHGFEAFEYKKTDAQKADKILKSLIGGEKIDKKEALSFKSFMISFLAGLYEKRGWVMQMHIGAVRNSNSRMFNMLGPDAGFDSMGDWSVADALNRYLDDMTLEGKLPRTILYNLNAKDNDVFASMMGNFARENSPAYVDFGTAWWFYDQKDGIEKQLTSFANLSLLGRFVGMVTDSRSFLSFTRHEYFRRVACNLIGRWAEAHMIPKDDSILGSLVKKISYQNALEYFD